MKKQDTHNNHEGAAAAGLAALAAAAAGVYFLYGTKDAAKKRKAVKSWSLKMKAEVLEKIEKLKEIDQKTYQDIVDAASKKYESLKGVEVSEVAAISKELSSHWKAIKKTITPEVKKAKKVVKKVAGKVEKEIASAKKVVAKKTAVKKTK
jgi:hypothetical protein